MTYPPGPRGLETFGFFGRGLPGGTLTFLEQTARKYGPISSFRVLNKRLYLVDDAELIKEILVTKQHSFERDSGRRLLRELLGDSLVTLDEPLHRVRRRILQPAFHREQIAHYGQIMSAETERFAAEWRDGVRLDIRKEMQRLTLAIVGSALFGADFRHGADEVAEVLQSVMKKSRWLAPAFVLIEPLTIAYRRFFPNGRSLFFPAERKRLERIIAPILTIRRGAATKDILSLILNARSEEDEPLTEDEVRNEIVTFMLAGHETTATALTWSWYLLAKHPHVAERMQAELDENLGERPCTLEDIPKLPYTNAVFQEAMRLYPPALGFARRAKEDLELGGYVIRKGTSVFISPYITQRNPAYFPEPEVFRPERWGIATVPKFAYFPFGGGAKMCIGEPFAKMEGVIALAQIGRKWEVNGSSDDKIGIGPGMLLKPDRPIVLTVHDRANSGTAFSHGLVSKTST